MAFNNPTGFFLNERTLCTCAGKPNEYILFQRVGRSTKRFYISNVQFGTMDKSSTYVPGDLIFDGTNYHFLVAKRDSDNVDRAEFYKSNCVVDVVTLAKHYTNATFDFYSEVALHTDSYCVFEDISANMKMYDPGLLSTTTRKFLLPMYSNVGLLDRVKFNGENMQIDQINLSDFSGFLYVQCSPDKRVSK